MVITSMDAKKEYARVVNPATAEEALTEHGYLVRNNMAAVMEISFDADMAEDGLKGNPVKPGGNRTVTF